MDAEFILRVILTARDELAGAIAKARLELQGLKTDANRASGEISGLNSSLSGLNSRLTNLRSRVQGLRQDLRNLTGEELGGARSAEQLAQSKNRVTAAHQRERDALNDVRKAEQELNRAQADSQRSRTGSNTVSQARVHALQDEVNARREVLRAASEAAREAEKEARATDNVAASHQRAGRSTGVLADLLNLLSGSHRRAAESAGTHSRATGDVERATGSASGAIRRTSGDVDRLSNSFGRGSQQAGSFTQRAGSLDNRLRGLVLEAILVFMQQFITILAGVGGELVSVGSSAIFAGGAIGGILAAGIAQVIPVLELLFGAFNRVRMVMQAVQKQNTVNQQESYRGQQNALKDLTATDQLANAQDSLRSALQQVRDAHQQVTDAQINLTNARREAARQLQDLVLQEKSAALAAKGAALDQKDAQRQLLLGIQRGDVSQLARNQLAVPEAALSKQQANVQAQRATQDRSRLTPLGVEGQQNVRQAEQQLRQARQSVTNAEVAVTRAQRGIVQAAAQAKQASANTFAAAGALNYMLAQLDPAEKRLYDAVTRLQKTYKQNFRGVTDSIVNSFTFAVNRATQLLSDHRLIQAARGLAGEIGHQFDNITRSFTDQKTVSQYLYFVNQAKQNLRPLETIAQNIGHAFLNIAQEASPAFARFLQFVARLTGQFLSLTNNRSKLEEFFNTAEHHLEAWIMLGVAVARFVAALAGIAQSQGLKSIQQYTGDINKATNALENHRSKYAGFFAAAHTVFMDILHVLGAVAVQIAKSFDPSGVHALAELLIATLIPALGNVIRVTGQLSKIFFNILTLPGMRELIQFGIYLGVFVKIISTVRGAWTSLLLVVGRFGVSVVGAGAKLFAFGAQMGGKLGVTLAVLGRGVTGLGTAFVALGKAPFKTIAAGISFIAGTPALLALTAFIAAIVVLQAKFNIIGKAIDFVKQHWQIFLGSLLGATATFEIVSKALTGSFINPISIIKSAWTKFWAWMVATAGIKSGEMAAEETAAQTAAAGGGGAKGVLARIAGGGGGAAAGGGLFSPAGLIIGGTLAAGAAGVAAGRQSDQFGIPSGASGIGGFAHQAGFGQGLRATPFGGPKLIGGDVGNFLGGVENVATLPFTGVNKALGALGVNLPGMGDPLAQLRKFGDQAPKELQKAKQAMDGIKMERLAQQAQDLARKFPQYAKQLGQFSQAAVDAYKKAAKAQVDTVVNYVGQRRFATEPKLLAQFNQQLRGMAPAARANSAAAMVEFAKSLEQQGRLPKGSTDKLIKDLERRWQGLAPALARSGHDSMTAVANTQRDRRVVNAARDTLHQVGLNWDDFPKLAKLKSANANQIWGQAMDWLKHKIATSHGDARRQAIHDLDLLQSKEHDVAQATQDAWKNALHEIQVRMQQFDSWIKGKTTGKFSIQTGLGAGINATLSRATGGPIPGSSGPVDITAHAGEHVITKQEVQAAGGHGVIYAIRRMLGGGSQGGPFSYAQGGAVQGQQKQGDTQGQKQESADLQKAWASAWAAVTKNTIDNSKQIINIINTLMHDVDKSTHDTMGQVQKRFHDIFGDIVNQSTSMSHQLVANIQSAMSNVDQAVYTGMNYIGTATNQALKSFGATTVKISVDKPAAVGKAEGGYVGLPGERGRDNQLTLLGRGEAVLTGAHQKIVNSALWNTFSTTLPGLFKGTRGTHAGIPGMGYAQGGYVNPYKGARSFSPGRIDEGFDAVVDGAIEAIGDALVTYAGGPVGWPGTGAVVYQFLNGTFKDKFVYLAENIRPVVHAGQRIASGTPIANAVASFPYTEMGWASGPNWAGGSQTLAKATTGYSEGQQTAAGKAFTAFLHTLGVSGAMAGNPNAVGAFVVPTLKHLAVHGKGPLKDIAKAALDKTTDAANQFMQKQSGSVGGTTGPAPVGNIMAIAQWAAKQVGLAWNSQAAQTIKNLLSAESSGGQNLPPSGPLSATGPFQVIPSTFASFALAGHKNIRNIVDNALAAMAYIKSRYKSIAGLESATHPHPGYPGYAQGGVVPGLPGQAVDITAHAGEVIFNEAQSGKLAKLVENAVIMVKAATALVGQTVSGTLAPLTVATERGASLTRGIGTPPLGSIEHFGQSDIRLRRQPKSWSDVRQQFDRFTSQALDEFFNSFANAAAEHRKHPRRFAAPIQKYRDVAIESALTLPGILPTDIDKLLDLGTRLTIGLSKLNKKATDYFDKLTKAVNGLVQDGGLFDQLDQARQTAATSLADATTLATYTIQRISKRITGVIQSSTATQTTERQVRDAEKELDQALGEQGILSRTLTALNKEIGKLIGQGKSVEHDPKLQKLVTQRNKLQQDLNAAVDAHAQALTALQQAQSAAIQARQDDVNRVASTALSRISSAQSIAQTFGNTAVLKSLADMQISVLQQQIGGLQRVLHDYANRLTPDERATIENQLNDLQSQIVQVATEGMQSVIDTINTNAQRFTSSIDLFNRMSAALGIQDINQRINIPGLGAATEAQAFQARGQVLGTQRAYLQNALQQALSNPLTSQNTKLTSDLIQQINDLTVQIQENTKALFEARIQDVNTRFSNRLNINDLKSQIIQATNALTGVTDVASMLANLTEKQTILIQQGVALQDLLNQAVAANDPQDIQSLTEAVLQNRLAQLQNTQAIKQLNGTLNQPISEQTTLWDTFRIAILSGMGNLLPQYGIPSAQSGALVTQSGLVGVHMGEVIGEPEKLMSRVASARGALSKEEHNYYFTEPMQVADPVAIGSAIAWRKRGKPRR